MGGWVGDGSEWMREREREKRDWRLETGRRDTALGERSGQG
jgi:hypothetical protein